MKICLTKRWKHVLRNQKNPGYSVRSQNHSLSMKMKLIYILKSWGFKWIIKLIEILCFKEHISICCCSGAKLCPILCDPINCSTWGFSVLNYLPVFAQTHAHWVRDAITHSALALNLSQHQGLFKWFGSLYHIAKVLELQLQHQSFQWLFRVDFL